MLGWMGRWAGGALLLLLGSGGLALADEFEESPPQLLGADRAVLSCAGQTQTTYKPPLSSTPADIAAVDYLELTMCVSPVGERVRRGYSQTDLFLREASCGNSLVQPSEQVVQFIWTTDTGREETSTLKLSRMVTSLSQTAVTITAQGVITQGKYAGYRLVQVTVYANLALGCAMGGTIDKESGQTTLSILPL